MSGHAAEVARLKQVIREAQAYMLSDNPGTKLAAELKISNANRRLRELKAPPGLQ